MNPVKNTTILYIDDDADDIAILQEAVHIIDPTFQLRDATNGQNGLRALQDMKNAHALPCLIVLDINMPGMDGRETFRKIREDEVLSAIPVVIFSTSDSPVDKLFFQGQNVGYITKPIEYRQLLEVAKRLLSYCDEKAA